MDGSVQGSLGTVLFAALSLIATAVTAIFAARSASRAQSVAMGAAESTLRHAITITRQKVDDFSLQVSAPMKGRRKGRLSAEEKVHLKLLEKAFRSAVGDNLNAYEDACAKYLDGKIDRERFKKTYVCEIQNLCNAKKSVIAEFMHPESTSKFQAIWKVYREWHIHEK